MIPESPLPDDPLTREVLGREVDAWWGRLSLGQRLSVAQPYVEANTVEGQVIEHGDPEDDGGRRPAGLPA